MYMRATDRFDHRSAYSGQISRLRRRPSDYFTPHNGRDRSQKRNVTLFAGVEACEDPVTSFIVRSPMNGGKISAFRFCATCFARIKIFAATVRNVAGARAYREYSSPRSFEIYISSARHWARHVCISVRTSLS